MNKTLPQNIIEEIEKRDLNPRPKFYFLMKRSVFWSLAALAIIIGGVSMAIIIFIFLDHDLEAAKYLNQSLIKNIMLSIPYIWLAIFALFVTVAKYSIRHTKRGYKYATAKIIIAMLVINIFLGLILNKFDLGSRINDFLSDTIPFYDSVIYTSKTAWSNPDKGLLGGHIISVTNGTEFYLQDFKNKIWKIVIDPNETDDAGGNNIIVGNQIKIVGVNSGENDFQAKQIFYWEN